MLSGFEERLLTELRAHVADRPAPAPGWSRRRVVLTAAAAVTVTGGALAVPFVGFGVGEQPAAAATASDILRGAARAALREPVLTARPDQWVYTELMIANEMPIGNDPSPTRVERTRVERWVTAGDGDAWTQVFHDESPPFDGGFRIAAPPDQPRPAGYLAGLPTDADEMARYLRTDAIDKALRAGRQYEGGPPPQWRPRPFETAVRLLDGYLPPASRAALFEAMSREPSVTLLPGEVRDAADRPGIALREVRKLPKEMQRVPGHPGVARDMIFDKETFAYLGDRHVGLTMSGKEVPGGSTARLRTAIVDRIRQVP
ncbi:CU044_5270 family protein [Asanoa sp. NPDC050611]|uniref:CU044_5270 family protein n=1 Tax=Asanoa sp. NPDC050611 TaxID=3157098 RepID=UPI0033D7E4D7